MLFKSAFHAPICQGEITSTVRIWLRPRVRVGGRYQLGSGSIEVQRIQEIGFEALTPALARRCGFASLVEMLKVAKHGAGERVFLIDFHYLDEPVPRALRSPGTATASIAEIQEKLAAMDRRAGSPWARAMLQIIAAHPGERAVDLAARLRRPRDEFKRDARKLKALGLTISLEVGYRLSPAAAALLEPGPGAQRKRRSR
jgi:hypothetical protein